jgi:uncharacterized membrane protein SpoIIM required for sporulation
MKNILKLEELAMFSLSIWALYFLNAEWWYYLLLLLGPDISLIGYAGGNKMGAIIYNLFHHKGVAVILFVTGLLLPDKVIEITGIILFGHSSMDRMFGYGLKLKEGFKHTHLGLIGKK